jgi:hypothetical protein
MTQQDEQERQRVALAQILKNAADNFAFTVQIIGLKAKTARARYVALKREGFETSEALQLCLKDVEL